MLQRPVNLSGQFVQILSFGVVFQPSAGITVRAHAQKAFRQREVVPAERGVQAHGVCRQFVPDRVDLIPEEPPADEMRALVRLTDPPGGGQPFLLRQACVLRPDGAVGARGKDDQRVPVIPGVRREAFELLTPRQRIAAGGEVFDAVPPSE